MAPSFRSRIQEASGFLKQESSNNDFSLTAHRNLEHGNGNDVRTSDLTANESSNAHDGVGEPVDQDENQGTDIIDKEVENGLDNNLHVADGQEAYDDDVDKPVNAGVKHMGSKRSRFQKQPGPSTVEELGSLNVTQKEPNSGGQVTTPRRRGRPAKNSLGLGGATVSTITFMTKSFPGKRKRGSAEGSLRRSSRAAAESATKQITEQSTKRPKALSAPSTPSNLRRKKAIPGLGTGSKSTPAKKLTKHEFEVEYILDTRKKAGATEYQVKWKGYHVKYNTWEPAANLTHCAKALKEFRAGWSK